MEPLDTSDFATRSERPSLASPSQPVRRRKRTIALASLAVLLVVFAAAWLELHAARSRTPQTAPLPQGTPATALPATAPVESPSAANASDPVPAVQPRPAALDLHRPSQPRMRGPDPGALTAKPKASSRGQTSGR